MTEKQIEARIVKYVEAVGGYCLKLVLASLMGFPDRTILLPGGRILFVEVKRPDKCKVYAAQLRWQERLRRLGFVCEFVTSEVEVAKLIKSL